jgi:hypothetical protein
LISQVSHLQGTSSWRTPSPRECTRNREKISASTNRWPASAAGAFAGGRLLPPRSPARHMPNSASRGARSPGRRGKSGTAAGRDLRLSAEDPGDRRRRGAWEEASEGEASAKRLEIWGGGVPARSVPVTRQTDRVELRVRSDSDRNWSDPTRSARLGSKGEEGKADEKVRRRWRRRGRGAGWRSCWWTGSGT